MWPALGLSAGLGLAALACGRIERSPGDDPGSAGSASGSGSVGVAGTPGDGPAVMEPPADVAGRWALFVFDDPVGVQLVQNGSELTGTGCAAGTPPLEDPDSFVGEFCGPIHGSVTSNKVQFVFRFESGGAYTYAADVTVSADRRRMTGTFHGVSDVSWQTAWMRVPEGERGLPRLETAPPEPLWGQYELTLMGSSAGATEYRPGKVYAFNFVRDGFATDLGSFWYTEWLYSPEDYSFEVGPVPATVPELATSLSVEANPVDGITWVQAHTATGNSYGFAAARKPP